MSRVRLLALAILVCWVSLASAQGPGIFIRPNCTAITAPVTNGSVCYNTTSTQWQVWNGSAWTSQIRVGQPTTTGFSTTDRALTTFQTATDTSHAYVGVAAQVHPPGDTSEFGIPAGNERVGISGYVISSDLDKTTGHLGGDFGIIIGALDPGGDSSVQNYAVGVNVYNGVNAPSITGRQAVGIAFQIGGTNADSHASQGILFVQNFVSPTLRWYQGIQFDPNTILGAASGGKGGIYFNKSQPDTFITMRPSDDADAVAMQVVDSGFINQNLMLMKSGRVLARRATSSVSVPAFSSVESTNDGMYFPAAGAVGISTGGTLRIQADSSGLNVQALKTTGSAGGKKVVCVDTTTGYLYASSTGTDCSN